LTDPVKPGEALKYSVNHDNVDPESVLGHLLSLIKSGSRVLELGCAAGSMTRILHERHGCQVDGLELDPVSAEQARPFCSRLLIGNLETVQWDGPFFQGQQYDHILIADVLEHMREPGQVLRGVSNLLASGGSILVSTPNISFAGVQAAIQAGWFPYAPTGLLDQGHVHFFTRFELEALVLQCGGVPVERRAVHWGPNDSEFASYWAELTPQAQQTLLSSPDATVYQWVVSIERPSEKTWRRCVMFAPERALYSQKWGQLVQQVNTLQQELEAGHQRALGMLDSVKQLRLRQYELERQLITQQQQAHTATAKLEQVFTSTSWRLTAPVRNARATASRWRTNASLLAKSLRTQGVAPTLLKVVKKLASHQAPTVPVGAPTSELFQPDWAAYRDWLNQYEQLPSDGTDQVAVALQTAGNWPTFSVIMPVFNPNLVWLLQAIESVRQQWYPHWQLIIVDDASTQQRQELMALLERKSADDPRIRVTYRESNGHISRATNDGLNHSTSDWVTFIDQDDTLAPHALWCLADAIRQNPVAKLVYSDEDKINETGSRLEPHFKPDWNPDLLLSYNYICHLAAYRRHVMLEVGGLRPGFEGAQDFDLALRFTEQCTPAEIVHVPRLLYHWRVHQGSTSSSLGVKPYAMQAGVLALEQALQRRSVVGSVHIDHDLAFQVKYDITATPPHVTLVVPTRNGGNLLKTCISSVLALTDYTHFDILIIDNGSDQPHTLGLLQDYAAHPRCSVVKDPRPFNYAALHNAAIPAAKGDFVLLLNDDIQVTQPDWLREMVSVGLQPGVGIVGARLLYPNNAVQHGGTVMVGGVAGHAHKHFPASHWGYMMRARVRQTLSAVTAACLLVRKEVYQQVGGMDETLAVAFNDVAFCLAVGAAGYRIVWTPYAELVHHESATRGHEHVDPARVERFNREIKYMQATWGSQLAYDPAWNPNLNNMREDFALAHPPRLKPLFPGIQVPTEPGNV